MDASKSLSNINIKGRLRQAIILITIILVGMAISNSIQAQDFHKAKSKHFKSKYRTQIRTNSKACAILARKRTHEPKKPMFAFLRTKPKYKPQAEVDSPSNLRISNKQVLTASLTRKE